MIAVSLSGCILDDHIVVFIFDERRSLMLKPWLITAWKLDIAKGVCAIFTDDWFANPVRD